MTIELPPELEQAVKEQVAAGRFASPAAAVTAAVERMLADDTEQKLIDLRAALDEGLADIEAGRFSEFTAKDIIAECRKAYDSKHGL